NAQCRRGANANEDRLCALLVRQTSCSQANDDGVIACQNQVDHDDLKERCDGLACQQSSHAASSLRPRTARMARVSALSRPPCAWLAILTRHRTGLRTRLSAHIALANDRLFYCAIMSASTCTIGSGSLSIRAATQINANAPAMSQSVMPSPWRSAPEQYANKATTTAAVNDTRPSAGRTSGGGTNQTRKTHDAAAAITTTE